MFDTFDMPEVCPLVYVPTDGQSGTSSEKKKVSMPNHMLNLMIKFDKSYYVLSQFEEKKIISHMSDFNSFSGVPGLL